MRDAIDRYLYIYLLQFAPIVKVALTTHISYLVSPTTPFPLSRVPSVSYWHHPALDLPEAGGCSRRHPPVRPATTVTAGTGDRCLDGPHARRRRRTRVARCRLTAAAAAAARRRTTELGRAAQRPDQ